MCAAPAHHFWPKCTSVARAKTKFVAAAKMPTFFLKEVEPDKGHSFPREYPRRQKPEEIQARGWPALLDGNR